MSMVRAACTVLLIYGLQFGYTLTVFVGTPSSRPFQMNPMTTSVYLSMSHDQNSPVQCPSGQTSSGVPQSGCCLFQLLPIVRPEE